MMRKTNQQKKNKGIPDGWTDTTLNKLFVFKNGLNKAKEFFGYGTPIVNYMDVHKQTSLIKSDVRGLVSVSPNELINNEARKGDIFFTRTSETLLEIGLASVLLDDIQNCVFSGYILRARPVGKEVSSEYFSHSLRTQIIRKEIMRKSSMTTRALTTGKFLGEVKYVYPPLPEQKRIVTVLETWDSYLEKLKRKIEIKKNIKKGLMQQLLTGKTRLGGFSGEWLEKRLGNIGETYQGLTGKTKEDFTNNKTDGKPFISYMNIYSNPKINVEDINTFVKLEMSEKQKTAKHGDIFFTTSSETPDEVGISSVLLDKRVGELYLNSFCFGFRLNNFNFIIPEFAQSYFGGQVFRKKMTRIAQGASRFNLSKRYFLETKIEIPEDLKEQKAIATILTTADAEINQLLCEQKLMGEQKKYLLNNLISGVIRTPEDLKINN